MEYIRTTNLTSQYKKDILNLWNSEYPEKLNYQSLSDFENYLNKLTEPSHILLLIDGKVKGWYVDFIREHSKWFVILLDSNIQGKGYGSKMLNLGKEGTNELNGWIIDHNNDLKNNGKNYISPLGFYLKNGFLYCFFSSLF